MNKLRILTISMVAAGSLFAGDALIDAAKNAGLKPIPSEHKAK